MKPNKRLAFPVCAGTIAASIPLMSAGSMESERNADPQKILTAARGSAMDHNDIL